MSDWRAFLQSVPWFVAKGANVRILPTSRGLNLSPTLSESFPPLAELLRLADVTAVSVNEESYQLLAWNSVDGYRIGWLCPTSAPNSNHEIHVDHAELLQEFGGIVERFNEPEDTWLLNQNDALTAREAAHDASFLRHYDWKFHDVGLKNPIEPTEYYSISREANGNNTLCHRQTGQVIMFAADHHFNHLEQFEGCPPYSLYKIRGVVMFRDWVNTVASQWLAHVALSE